MARTFLVNFWSTRTHTVAAKDEAELRALATKIATERRTLVGFYELVEGKTVLLGAVSGAVPSPVAEPRKKPPARVEPEEEDAVVERAEPKKAPVIRVATPAKEYQRLSLLE